MKLKAVWLTLSSLIVLGSLVLFLSCHKQPAKIVDNSSSSTAIAKAKEFFDSNVQTAVPMSPPSDNYRAGLHKTPLWEKAYAVPMNQGSGDNAVVAPVAIKENLNLIRSSGNFVISASLLTYLVMYPEAKGGYRTEVVTILPEEEDQSTQKNYTGMIRVENWQGGFLWAYHFTNGVNDKSYTSSGASYTNDNVKTPTSVTQVCATIDWFSCLSFTDGSPDQCSFVTEDTYCSYDNGGGVGGGTGPIYVYQKIYQYAGSTGNWVANPGYRICSNFSFSSDGNGNYVANVNGLSQGWTNSGQGGVSFSFPNTCLTIPSSGMSQLTASGYFISAYNGGLDRLVNELSDGTTSPQNAESRFVYLVTSTLAYWVPGATWDPSGNCSVSAINITGIECTP